MTIGVAASGTRAGAAVRAAVLGAELLGRGAIGGFAVYAILDEQGELQYRTTQRGGIGQLDIPAAWLEARTAAVISSGPDRPEPLTQFVPGAYGLGMVTGHRLPNRAGPDGVPLNQAVLDRLAAGQSAQAAVDAVLSGCPEADAGLIAVTAAGELGWGNSERVHRRPDRGSAGREQASARVRLLHNSIYAASTNGLSDVLAELAWTQMQGRPGTWQFLHLTCPVPVRAGPCDRVHIDASGHVQSIESSDPHVPWFNGRATVVYLGAEVWCGDQKVGRAMTDVYANLGEGKATPLQALAQRTFVMRADHVQA